MSSITLNHGHILPKWSRSLRACETTRTQAVDDVSQNCAQSPTGHFDLNGCEMGTFDCLLSNLA